MRQSGEVRNFNYLCRAQLSVCYEFTQRNCLLSRAPRKYQGFCSHSALCLCSNRYWTPENVNKSKIGNKSKTAVFICNGKAIVVVVVVGRRRCCCYLFNHFFNCAICLAITPTNEISKKIKTANNTGGGTREEEQKKKQNKQLPTDNNRILLANSFVLTFIHWTNDVILFN